MQLQSPGVIAWMKRILIWIAAKEKYPNEFFFGKVSKEGLKDSSKPDCLISYSLIPLGRNKNQRKGSIVERRKRKEKEEKVKKEVEKEEIVRNPLSRPHNHHTKSNSHNSLSSAIPNTATSHTDSVPQYKEKRAWQERLRNIRGR